MFDKDILFGPVTLGLVENLMVLRWCSHSDFRMVHTPMVHVIMDDAIDIQGRFYRENFTPRNKLFPVQHHVFQDGQPQSQA